MDYIFQTKTLFIGDNDKNILTVNIEMLLDPLVNYLKVEGEGKDLDLN